MLASLMLVAALTAPAGEEKVSYFRGSFDEALTKAKSEKKPVFIDFYTDWCGWCKRLDQDTLSDGTVAAHLKGYVNLKIDAEKGEGPEVAKRFGVRGFPTIIVADHAGEEIDRIIGYMKPDGFLKTLKEYQSGNNFQALLKDASKRPDDVQVQFALAKKWKDRDQNEKAAELFGKIIAADPENKNERTIQARGEVAFLALVQGDWKPLAAFAKEFPDPKHSLMAHRALAQVLEQEDDLDGAEASFELVQNHGPADPNWMNSYAWFLATNDRNLGRATELASKATQAEPKNPAFLDTLAECYFRTKQFAKAVETQKKAVDLITNKKTRKEYEERLRKFEEALEAAG